MRLRSKLIDKFRLKRKNIYNQIKAAMNKEKDADKQEAPEKNINDEIDAS